MDFWGRLKLIIDIQKISINKFEDSIGASRGVIAKALRLKTDISSKWVVAIKENYPQYSLDWLMLGKGEMLDNGSSKKIEYNFTKEHIEQSGTLVKQRIKQVLSAFDSNPTQLSKLFGVNQKTLNNQINGDVMLSINTILLIKTAFPDIGLTWLITGEGEEIDNYAQTNHAPITDNKFAMELIEKKDAKIKSLERKIWEQEKKIEELKHHLNNLSSI